MRFSPLRFVFLAVGMLPLVAFPQTLTRFAQNQSLPYTEVIAAYQSLADRFPKQARLITGGNTDTGLPLHLFVLDPQGGFEAPLARQRGQRIVFVNNGIHPGEPCGIDASLQLAQDLLENQGLRDQLLQNVVLCIVPVYNVGGALNRSCCSRANQVGPEAYGFRGNARNLDLNRDFIKQDSRNAQAFTQFFREWDPHVFVDTHTTDGADYPYTMTLIPTQADKLPPTLAAYLRDALLPDLYARMESAGHAMCPYVDPVKRTPEDGLKAFLDLPRYSSGYTALFQTIGFTTEAHMLKPFPDRVRATYAFLQSLLAHVSLGGEAIASARATARQELQRASEVALNWELDENQSEPLRFRGYPARYQPSEVTGRS